MSNLCQHVTRLNFLQGCCSSEFKSSCFMTRTLQTEHLPSSCYKQCLILPVFLELFQPCEFSLAKAEQPEGVNICAGSSKYNKHIGDVCCKVIFVKEKSKRSWEDDSVCMVLATEAWGPVFDAWHSGKAKCDTIFCNLRAEKGGPRIMLVSQSGLISELQVQRYTPWLTRQLMLASGFQIYAHTCVHTRIHTHGHGHTHKWMRWQ